MLVCRPYETVGVTTHNLHYCGFLVASHSVRIFCNQVRFEDVSVAENSTDPTPLPVSTEIVWKSF